MYNQQTTRFENTKSDEYFLLRKVWPHFIELQRYIGQLCAKENGAQGNKGIPLPRSSVNGSCLPPGHV
jgi:hypothetical protein